MAIGPLTIKKAKEMLIEQIDTYANTIADAYDQQDGELSVALSLKFRAVGEKVRMDYGISFVQDRVKDGDSMVIDEKQQTLPFPSASVQGAARRFVDTLNDGDSIEASGLGLEPKKLVKRGGKMVEV